MVIKMQFGKRILLLLCAVLMLFSMFPAIRSGASSGPSLVTTLTDNAVQRGSKKNFDVWARNASGEKIRAIVTHNGTRLEPTWDDSEKASYTLNFTEEGENIVTVSASSDGGKKKQLTYCILYRRAEPGEEIGRAIWSVEAFTVGCGYIIEPTEVPIREGETAAEQLLRLLSENGLVGYYGGTAKSSFYLAYIADGTVYPGIRRRHRRFFLGRHFDSGRRHTAGGWILPGGGQGSPDRGALPGAHLRIARTGKRARSL